MVSLTVHHIIGEMFDIEEQLKTISCLFRIVVDTACLDFDLPDFEFQKRPLKFDVFIDRLKNEQSEIGEIICTKHIPELRKQPFHSKFFADCVYIGERACLGFLKILREYPSDYLNLPNISNKIKMMQRIDEIRTNLVLKEHVKRNYQISQQDLSRLLDFIEKIVCV